MPRTLEGRNAFHLRNLWHCYELLIEEALLAAGDAKQNRFSTCFKKHELFHNIVSYYCRPHFLFFVEGTTPNHSKSSARVKARGTRSATFYHQVQWMTAWRRCAYTSSNHGRSNLHLIKIAISRSKASTPKPIFLEGLQLLWTGASEFS